MKNKGLELNEDTYKIAIDVIFRELMGAYPAWRQAWKDTYELHLAKISWHKTLQDAGISNTIEIEIGLKHCRRDTSPFVISAGQFVEWCLYPVDKSKLIAYIVCENNFGENNDRESNENISHNRLGKAFRNQKANYS